MNDEITINGIVYVRKDACSCPFMNKGNENTNKKYGFTGETITYCGHTLHRIIALKDFGNVRKGDIGGWIEREDNLSHEGNCWVDDNAKEWENAEARICEVDQKCTKVGVVDDVMNVEDYILNTTDKAIIISNGHVCR